MVLKRVGVWSVAQMSGLVYAVMGLVFGALFGLFSLLGLGAAMAGGGNMDAPGGAILGLFFGVGAIVFFPVLYGVMGLVTGAIGAALYNLFAGVVGGIEVDLQAASPGQ